MKLKSKFKVHRQAILFLLLINTLISATPVLAQEQDQYFISPKLQLGLHTQASLESPIKKLITSGTAVEVTKTENEFSQIKTQDGIDGWVKSQFLTQDEPAIQKIEKLEQTLQEALSKNVSLSNSMPEAPAANTISEQLLSDKDKEAYEDTIFTLQEELKAWEQLDYQDKQAKQIQAEKYNQQLKERLSMIASLAIGKEVASSQFEVSSLIELPQIINDSNNNILKIFKKNYLILMMVSGVSFLFGIFVMDAFNRRRHGGYRV